MKRSLPLAAVLCAALLLSVARGRAQNLYVGSNAANVTTNFTSGTNAFASIYVGYTNNWAFSATNNLLTVSGAGTVLTNSSYLYVGFNGSDNRLIISNGGQVISGTGSLGSSSTSTNNSVLVTGTNSRWTLQKFTTGTQSHANSLVISNGGQVIDAGMTSEVLSSSNRILVTGVGSLLDVSNLYFGYENRPGNSLVISNGATVAASFSFIGTASSSNSVLVTGTGSLFTNSDSLTIGLGILGVGNRMVVSNGGKVISGDVVTGAGSSRYNQSPPPGSVDPTSVLVTGTNSLLIATNSLTVGVDSDNNRLTVADGGSVSVGQNLIINQFYPNTNGFDQAGSLVLVQSGRLSVTNGTISFGNGLGTLQVDGGTVEVQQLLATSPITPSGQISPAERRGSYVLLNGGTIISGSTTISNQSGLSDNRSFSIGGNSGSGATFIANGGTHSFWANVAVGDAGSSNSLVITNNAEVFLRPRPDSNHGPSGGTNLVIGVAAGASNNSVSISSGRLVMTNGTLEIGRAGSGILNVHNGGTVQAPNVVVASQAGSSGTLNIGRFGTNDSAGTISAATIAFGAGTGVVNFNQSNSVTMTSTITGANLSVNQHGTGTTLLTAASNSYGGVTTISGGALQVTDLANEGIVSPIGTNGTIILTNGGNFDYVGTANASMNRAFNLAGGNGGIGVSNSLVAVTFSGVISNTGNLVKSGSGTLILSASNSYTGAMTVSAGTLELASLTGSAAGYASSVTVANGATLLVSQSEQVNNSATVTLSGGTITRGSGVSEVFGSLNLTESSFLDFGTETAGDLTFGTYTPSSLLTINNFGLGNTLVFGSDLTSTINNSSFFTFTNGGIGSSSWNQSASTFTITAIPEPSTYLAAIGLLALMLWPLRRRLRGKVS